MDEKCGKLRIKWDTSDKSQPLWWRLLKCMRRSEELMFVGGPVIVADERQAEVLIPHNIVQAFLRSSDRSMPRLVVSEGNHIATKDRFASYVAEKHGVSRSTVWRLHRKFARGGLTELLRKRRVDKGISRHFTDHPQQLRFVEALYVTQNVSMLAVHSKLIEEFYSSLSSAKAPVYETVRLQLKSIPKLVIHLGRDGDDAFFATVGTRSDEFVQSFESHLNGNQFPRFVTLSTE